MKNENNLPTNAAKEVSLQHPLLPSLTGKPIVTPTPLTKPLPSLYILLKTLLALQITDVQKVIIGVQEAIA